MTGVKRMYSLHNCSEAPVWVQRTDDEVRGQGTGFTERVTDITEVVRFSVVTTSD